MKKRLAWILVTAILLVASMQVQVDAKGQINTLVWNTADEQSSTENTSESQNTEGNENTAGAPEIQTPHAAVMEVSTGTILYEKNADETAHPASVTKIMTILMIFESIENGKLTFDTEVVTSAHAKSMGGSQVFLEEGEVQTVETLLKCIIIASGNDAAVAMAEKISGTEEAFVAAMNERAVQLGMENTHFVDCCGLTDSADHYTTARDVAIMSRELLYRFPQVVEYSNIWMEDITHVTNKGSSVFTLTNTNKLLRGYEGCDGLKTGSTSLAKFCLSATARRDGIRMISVVMTSPDSKTRFREAGNLLSYGFSRCSLYEDEEMETLPQVKVKGTVTPLANVKYEQIFSYLSTSGEDFSSIEKEIIWQEEIRAPLEAGDVVGEYVYTLNGKELGRVPIVLTEAVEQAGYLDWLEQAWKYWIL